MIIINYSLPPTPSKRFETKADAVLIGRSTPEQAADVDLTPDSTVSRRHARLTLENDAGGMAEEILDGRNALFPRIIR